MTLKGKNEAVSLVGNIGRMTDTVQGGQTMVQWPGFAEMTNATEDNFMTVPSTEAALSHINNSAEGLDEEDVSVLMSLAVDVRADGKAEHPR